MPATTTLLGLVTPTQGTLSGTWGDTVNYGISDYVDISVAGTLTLTNDGAVTLANTTGSSAGNNITSTLTGAGTVTAQFAIVKVTGTLTVAKVVTGPSYSKTYTVVNAATGGIVTFKASGQTGVSVAVGESAFVYFNGTDYVKVSGTVAVASFQTSLGGLTPSTATTGVVTLAGTLNTTSGGTGLTSFTAGDVPYYASGSVLSKLAIGTAGQFLTSTGTAPQWSTLSGVAVTTFSAGTTGFTPSSATSGAVTLAGTLATTNGGTGLTSFTSGGVVYASSSSALATGSALSFDGTNLGIGTNSPSAKLDITSASGGFSNIKLVQTGVRTWAIENTGTSGLFKIIEAGVSDRFVIGAAGQFGIGGANYGTNGQVLTSSGSGAAPTWTTVGGASAATPTALGTVYGKQTSGGGSPYLTAYGYNAAVSNTGISVTAIGTDALYANTTANNVTAVGYQALYANTATSNSTAVGANAGKANTTGQVDAFGLSALQSNTTGAYNQAFGGAGQGYTAALQNNTTGINNQAFGSAALQANTTGGSNVAMGTAALYANTTASQNTAVGYQAIYTQTTGANNTAIGYQALYSNTTASNNVAIGHSALYANTTGDISVAIGRNALLAQTTATQNVAIGYNAADSITTSSYNVAIGVSALSTMVNGAQGNVAIGQNALLSYVNTSVSEGGAVAVGMSALQNCTTGGSNIAMGRNAGLGVTTGAINVIIGNRAGESANCSYGTFLGEFCGIYTTGDYNTFIGWQAGHNTTSTTTGTLNVYVGAAAKGSAVTNSSEIVIGSNATGKGSSTGFINPNSGGVYQGNNSSTWSTTSDRRLKKNIVDNTVGLDAITSIRVRNFEYRLPEEVDTELKPADAVLRSGVQLGVIAQELQAVLPECVKTESTGVMSVDTDNLIWYAINAIKELKAEFDAYKASHP